jgi:hypothetical protein
VRRAAWAAGDRLVDNVDGMDEVDEVDMMDMMDELEVHSVHSVHSVHKKMANHAALGVASCCGSDMMYA